jgi:hypothetical protein
MKNTKKKFRLSALMISAGAFAAVYLPGVAYAATADTDELFATVKKVFKDGSGLFLTLMGVVIFIAAAFWIFSSIAQWTKGKLDMGEMLIHVFIAIVGIMIALWMINKAETKLGTIAYHEAESPAFYAQSNTLEPARLSTQRV